MRRDEAVEHLGQLHRHFLSSQACRYCLLFHISYSHEAMAAKHAAGRPEITSAAGDDGQINGVEMQARICQLAYASFIDFQYDEEAAARQWKEACNIL